MEKNLIVQEAISNLLKGNNALLNNGQALMEGLKKQVPPSFSLDLAFFSKALIDANIGELMASLTDLNESEQQQVKDTAVTRLKKINIPEGRALSVVETIMDAVLATSQQPGHTAEDYYNDGMAAIDEGEFASAIELFTKSIETDENNTVVVAYRERGKCYYSLKQYENAKADLEKYAQFDSSDAFVRDLIKKIDGIILPPPPPPPPVKTAEDYYNDGERFINEKNFSGAISAFSSAIEKSPAFIAAYSMRGMLYAKNGQYSKAVLDYGKVIEKSAEADILPYHSISAYHNRALCYFELKDYHPALDDCNVVLKIDHNNSEAIALRKKILDIVAPPPPPPPVWHENGLKEKFFSYKGRLNRKRYFLRGMVIGAIQGLILGIDKASENNAFHLSENTEIFLGLLMLAILLASIISHFMLVIRRLHDNDKSGWWAVFFSSYYISVLSPKLAIVNVIGWPLALYLLFKKGNNGFNRFGADPLGGTANRDTYNETVVVDNADDQKKGFSTTKKIIIAFFTGVLAVFLLLVALIYHDREMAREYNERGIAYSEEEEYEKAIAEYDEAIKKYSKYKEAYCNRGIAYREDIEYEKALNDFNRAIEIDPKYAEAYYNRGLTYYEDVEYDKAFADFNQAITLNSNYADAFFARGMIYYKNKEDYDKALSDFDSTIKINPNHAEAFLNRGLIYENVKKQYDRAMDDYTKVIAIAPKKYDTAYNNRGVLYYNKGDYLQAADDFQQAYSINPKDDVIKNNLSNILDKIKSQPKFGGLG